MADECQHVGPGVVVAQVGHPDPARIASVAPIREPGKHQQNAPGIELHGERIVDRVHPVFMDDDLVAPRSSAIHAPPQNDVVLRVVVEADALRESFGATPVSRPRFVNLEPGSQLARVLLEGDYAQMSSEEIINQNPDIILLGDAEYGITPESVAERPGWDVIAAVKNGQVLPFDPFLVSVPGPRMVDGLEALAAIFHPELFE